MGSLPNLKELDKLIALCRRRGISSIEFNGLKLTLGDPVKKVSRRPRNASQSPNNKMPEPEIGSDLPSHDELLFWSAGAPTE